MNLVSDFGSHMISQTDRFRRVVNDAVYYQLLPAVDAAENGSFESGSAHLRIQGALLSETIRPMKLADLSGRAEQLVRGSERRHSKFATRTHCK